MVSRFSWSMGPGRSSLQYRRLACRRNHVVGRIRRVSMMVCRRSTGAGALGRWVMSTALTVGMAVAAHAAPVITGFNVAQAPMGSNLIIYGADLGDAQGQSFVKFGDAVLPTV